MPRKNNKRGKSAALSDGGATAASYATGRISRKAKISRSTNGTRVVHSELINTLDGGAGFGGFSVDVNPGLPGAFPFLSTIADGFQQYKFHRLEFEYVTRQGTASKGNVILAPDYEAADTGPSSEAILSTLAGAVEDVVWKNFPMECSIASCFAQGAKKLIRHTPIFEGLEKQLYDACTLHAYSTDTDVEEIGKLWVHYDVEFFAPGIPTRVQSIAGRESCVLVLSPTTPTGTAWDQFGTTQRFGSLSGLLQRVPMGGLPVAGDGWKVIPPPTWPGDTQAYPDWMVVGQPSVDAFSVGLQPGVYEVDFELVLKATVVVTGGADLFKLLRMGIDLTVNGIVVNQLTSADHNVGTQGTYAAGVIVSYAYKQSLSFVIPEIEGGSTVYVTTYPVINDLASANFVTGIDGEQLRITYSRISPDPNELIPALSELRSLHPNLGVRHYPHPKPQLALPPASVSTKAMTPPPVAV